MKRLMQIAFIILATVALAAVVRTSQKALDVGQEIRFVDKRPVFLPRGEALKMMSLGYRGLVADWLWISTVLYYGRRIVEDDNAYYVYMQEKGDPEAELGQVSNISPAVDTVFGLPQQMAHLLYNFENRGLVDAIYPMLERVTTVDPHFVFPYLFGGVYVLMGTGEIDAALALLEKGRKANPERWEFPFYLGWIHWMYRGDIAKTTTFLSQAVKLEGCPRYVGDLYLGITQKLGQVSLTRLYLEGLLESTDNPEVRARIAEMLGEMAGKE